jgi:hypothetical protein
MLHASMTQTQIQIHSILLNSRSVVHSLHQDIIASNDKVSIWSGNGPSEALEQYLGH